MIDPRHVPTDAREQAVQIREIWHNIGEDAVYGDLTLPDFKAQLTELDDAATAMSRLED